jgi:hypothetical protein
MSFHHNIRGVKTHEEISKDLLSNKPFQKFPKDKITNFKTNFEKKPKRTTGFGAFKNLIRTHDYIPKI